MQIVYRARSIADARRVCGVLAAAQITSHIADQELWEIAGQRPDADVIRVLVDNRSLDKARRLLQGAVEVPRLESAVKSLRVGAGNPT
jgi:hypothetical protein